MNTTDLVNDILNIKALPRTAAPAALAPTNVTVTLTLTQFDAIQYAIARRRQRVAEVIGCTSPGDRAWEHFREEERELRDICATIARACHRAATMPPDEATVVEARDEPSWMEGHPVELD